MNRITVMKTYDFSEKAVSIEEAVVYVALEEGKGDEQMRCLLNKWDAWRLGNSYGSLTCFCTDDDGKPSIRMGGLTSVIAKVDTTAKRGEAKILNSDGLHIATVVLPYTRST